MICQQEFKSYSILSYKAKHLLHPHFKYEYLVFFFVLYCHKLNTFDCLSHIGHWEIVMNICFIF